MFDAPPTLELLDQLSTKLLECVLVATVVQERDEVDLLDLVKNLASLQKSVDGAYRAVSLPAQGAELAPTNRRGVPRAKDIVESHALAVRRGAVEVVPYEPSSCALGAAAARVFAMVDRVENHSIPGPTCETSIKSSRRCKNSAAYLGEGAFASHCVQHLTSAERRAFAEYQDELAAQNELAVLEHARFLRQAAHFVIADWQSDPTVPNPLLKDYPGPANG